jgi:formylglycine-generating enzyme required for sulfatase activity
MPEPKRPLKVFLCHSSQDKPIVFELYKRLLAEDWIDPWLDKEKLKPGQDFDSEIEKAIESADAVVAFISKSAVSKTGYIQKELKLIYNAAMFKPEGMVFAIPLRLEECDPPYSLKLWHWADYFGDEKEKTYKSLLKSLEIIYGNTSQIDAEEEQEAKLKRLESQAVQCELRGDFWNASRTWYEIKAIDSLFPRVDVKIKELERELRLFSGDKQCRNCGSIIPASTRYCPICGRNYFTRMKPWGEIKLVIGAISLLLIVSVVVRLLMAPSIEKRLHPMPVATETATATITLTSKSITPSKTIEPSQTPTKVIIPTATPVVFNPHPDSTDYIDFHGVPMRLVPKGTFTMGADNVFPVMSPAHTVKLTAYYIDKFEVTNKLYMACVDAGKCSAPKQFNSKTRAEYYGNTSFDNYPVIFVTWEMANKYCQNWRGAELPTEAQWEMAASGADFNFQQNIYPWQANIISETYSNYKRKEGDTTPVGNYQLGKSPYEIYDMSGNVWEWVRDSINPDSPYYGDPDGVLNPLGAPDNGFKIIRGGGWNNTEEENLRVDFRGYQLGISFIRDNLGFRCARSANP